MDRPTEAATVPPAAATPTPTPPPEPVQRWRIRFARDPVPSEDAGRAAMDAWQATLAASGLPLAGLEPGGPGRARFVVGAPLPAAATGRAELADIWLLERLPAWAIREALEPRMPSAHRFVDAENVWLGVPPLPGQVVAAVWSVTLGPPAPDPGALERATRTLIDARTLPRTRARAGGDRSYDLRPLLDALEPAPFDAAGRPTLRITTRFDPALGAGRPEEVVGALGELIGTPLVVASLTREQLVLADPRREPPSSVRATGSGRRPRR